MHTRWTQGPPPLPPSQQLSCCLNFELFSHISTVHDNHINKSNQSVFLKSLSLGKLNKRLWDHNWRNYSSSASVLTKIINRNLWLNIYETWKKNLKNQYITVTSTKTHAFHFLFKDYFIYCPFRKSPLYFKMHRKSYNLKILPMPIYDKIPLQEKI